MTIGVAKELHRDESRLAMAPQSAKDLQKLGYECLIEKGTGVASGGSGVVAKVRPPKPVELKKLHDAQTMISFSTQPLLSSNLTAQERLVKIKGRAHDATAVLSVSGLCASCHQSSQLQFQECFQLSCRPKHYHQPIRLGDP